MEKKKRPTHMMKDWDIMMECFMTYRDTTDTNLFISRDYVIPSIATFPSHLHGIKLGTFLQKARQAYHADHFDNNSSCCIGAVSHLLGL